MCLMWGLVEGNQINKGVYDDHVFCNFSIAKYYAEWIESEPFDIGMAT